MNVSNPYYNSHSDKINNARKPCTLLEVDCTIGMVNECQLNNENDEFIDRNEGDFTGVNETELVSSFEGKVERENLHFSFFLETDNRLSSNGNDKVPLWSYSCSSSSSSTTATLNYSSSTDNNSKDDDGINNDDQADNTLEARRNAGQTMFVRSAFKDLPEFAIARSRIAVEAANEALSRKGLSRSNLDMDTSRYTITSVGRGSSASDTIHERDKRLLWKQGFDNEIDNGGDGLDESVGNINHKVDVIPGPQIDFDFPIMSIAEQAAAVGLLKQQQRNGKYKMPVDDRDQPDPKNKIKSVRSTEDKVDAGVDIDNDSRGVTETEIKLFDSDGDITGTTSVTAQVFITIALVLGRLSWKLKRIRSNNVPEGHEE